MTDALIHAPWTFEQIVALDAWQHCDWVHPFTCGNRDDHPELHGDKGVLIPTARGWVCQFCDYTQDWAHRFMFGPLPSDPFKFQDRPTE